MGIAALPHALASVATQPLDRKLHADQAISHLVLVTAVDSETPRLAASLLAQRWLIVYGDVATSIMWVREAAEVEPGSSVAEAGHVQAEAAGEGDDKIQIWGDVRLFMPKQGCVACVGGLTDPEQTLYELAAPAGTLQRGTPLTWDRQRAGSLVTINAMAVSTLVAGWLDSLSGALRSSHWYRLRWVPGTGIQADAGAVGAADVCPFCRIKW